MTLVTYFGHSCFLVETMGVKILFDPFISPNDLAKEINLDSISCDYIFISHGHFDHIADLEYLAKKTQAKVVGSWELTNWLANKGLKNSHPMNIGGSWDFGFGTVKMVIASHSNSFPDNTYGGLAAGYIFNNDEICFYYAGDTALTMDMKLIADEFLLDFAFLPIGNNFTMNTKDAARAAKFINCKTIIGMHYDTFGYIKLNHLEAKDEFEKEGLMLKLLKIGLSENLGKTVTV
jgi:L-ascorbate metabolism protein UlaG (beta-lactamase superfamily)